MSSQSSIERGEKSCTQSENDLVSKSSTLQLSYLLCVNYCVRNEYTDEIKYNPLKKIEQAKREDPSGVNSIFDGRYDAHAHAHTQNKRV